MAHKHLRGAIFRRKKMDLKRYTGLASFGVAGVVYNYFPYMAAHVGNTATMAALCALSFYGMINFRENKIINTISRLTEGENAGKLMFNVSKSLISSRDVIVDMRNCQGVLSLENDDIGEDGV
jgi:hypothetical protein